MCLFKVYLAKNGKRELVAEGVAIAKTDKASVELYNPALTRLKTIANAEIIQVDTLNEVLILKEKFS